MSELSDLTQAIGLTDDRRVAIIKETAMNRRNVKMSRRRHIRRVLDEAFALLREIADSGNREDSEDE